VKKCGKKNSDVLYWFQQTVNTEEASSFDSYVVGVEFSDFKTMINLKRMFL
jgi:hypothetical protein